jgi:hypothetical protein
MLLNTYKYTKTSLMTFYKPHKTYQIAIVVNKTILYNVICFYAFSCWCLGTTRGNAIKYFLVLKSCLQTLLTKSGTKENPDTTTGLKGIVGAELAEASPFVTNRVITSLIATQEKIKKIRDRSLLIKTNSE